MRSIDTQAVGGPQTPINKFNPSDRRHFIGGSDARIIMGHDGDALVRLWQEKRGEVASEDLTGNLIVQLGTVTEVLNRAWYQRFSGMTVKDVQKRVRHPVHKWMGATLDGVVEQTGASLKQSSCCLGLSQRRLRPRNIWRNCNTTCG